MKKTCLATLLLLFFIGLFSMSARGDELLSLKAAFISLNPDGKFAATGSGIEGTKMDVDQDLGMGRDYNGLFEAALNFGDFRLSASYMPVSFSGTRSLAQSVGFNDQTFASGTSVKSDLNADILDVGLAYYFANFDDLPTRVQLGVEVAIKTIMADIKLSGGGINETRSSTVPIPTIGVRGRVALADYLGLIVRGGGLGYGGNRFFDGEVQLEFSPLPMVGLHAGYRYISLKVDRSGVFVDVNFSGPFLGAFVRF